MNICLVCSHGGHLTEMDRLKDAFEGCTTFYITYDSARTRLLPNAYLVQNFAEKPFSIFSSTVKIIKILFRENPEIIISTGAEIALPVLCLARMVTRARTIYIESWCRVSTPSVTGRIAYHLSDIFLVQWPQLLACYGHKARFEGAVI